MAMAAAVSMGYGWSVLAIYQEYNYLNWLTGGGL
jgi:hypothetical protein